MSHRDILAAAARRFADDPTDPNLADLIADVMDMPIAEMPAGSLDRPIAINPVLADLFEAGPGPFPPTITIAGDCGDVRRIIGTIDSLGNRSTIQFAKAE